MWVSWSLSDIYCLFPFFIPFRFFLLYCLFTPIDFYKQSCSIKLEMEFCNLYIYCNFFHLSFSISWKGKEKQKQKRKRKRKRKLWNFWENKVEAEAEAVPKIWKRKRKRFWKIKLKWKRKRKRFFFHCGSGSGSFLILSGGWKRKRKLLKNFRNSSLHIIFKCEFFISLCQFFSNLL